MGSNVVFLNGQMVSAEFPHLSALDRGFTLGDGVFDTLRAVRGRVFRLKDHLERLQRSATAIGLALPMQLDDLGDAVSAVLAANSLADALVRITVSRGVPAERGLLPPQSPRPSLAIHAVPYSGYPRERQRRGFKAAIVGIRRNESSPLSYVKSCNYLDSVLARMQADSRGADEALLLNTVGWLACGASSNVFLIADEALVTPSLECGVLEGVTRKTVLELSRELGLGCTERPIVSGELCLAEEAFVTNTAIGVMPLAAVGDLPIGNGNPGAITLRLQSAYTELLLGV